MEDDTIDLHSIEEGSVDTNDVEFTKRRDARKSVDVRRGSPSVLREGVAWGDFSQKGNLPPKLKEMTNFRMKVHMCYGVFLITCICSVASILAIGLSIEDP